jgi:uncharacterized protein YkwD
MKTNTLNLFLLLFSCAVLLSCSNEDDGIFFTETTDFEISIKDSYSEIESEILTLVNEYRISLNLSELKTLNIISSVAATHTNYMIEVGEINHDHFSKRAQNLIDKTAAKKVAENVAYGYATAQGVMSGWLNSENHKRIIENPDFTHFGISTKSNSEGRNFFTQIFIAK